MGDLPSKAWIFYQEPEHGSHPVVQVEPEDGEDFTLDELQGFVGGLIEKLPIPGHIIFANEESGMYDEFVMNTRFVMLFAELLATYVLMGPKMIAGNVILMDTPALRENAVVMEYLTAVAGVA